MLKVCPSRQDPCHQLCECMDLTFCYRCVVHLGRTEWCLLRQSDSADRSRRRQLRLEIRAHAQSPRLLGAEPHLPVPGHGEYMTLNRSHEHLDTVSMPDSGEPGAGHDSRRLMEVLKHKTVLAAPKDVTCAPVLE